MASKVVFAHLNWSISWGDFKDTCFHISLVHLRYYSWRAPSKAWTFANSMASGSLQIIPTVCVNIEKCCVSIPRSEISTHLPTLSTVKERSRDVLLFLFLRLFESTAEQILRILGAFDPSFLWLYVPSPSKRSIHWPLAGDKDQRRPGSLSFMPTKSMKWVSGEAIMQGLINRGPED